MIDLNNLSFGQRLDGGLIQPWFTHGALDRIASMDLSNSNILQFGSGLGDAWLARRCKKLVSIERNEEWLYKVQEMLSANNCTNATLIHRPCNDSSGRAEYYLEIPEGFEPDIIIVDDAYRYECIVSAIEYSKENKKDIVLIIDNWQQDYVFICPAAEEALKEYKSEVFLQQDHTDHSGHPWQTLIAYL